MVPDRSKLIFLADMESFYASVETSLNPAWRGKPVVVCGDPERRRGIVLAASKEAKAYGIKTGFLAGECRRLCPEVILVKPRMHTYLQFSLRIMEIFRQFSDRVLPYSIDELFLDMTGCEKLFGPPQEMAREMIRRVWEETGIRCRIGIGENPLQAKMACDCFAKKSSEGVFALNHENYAFYTWPLPVSSLFGVGSRMESHFQRMAIRTIGHLARLPRESLRRRWGVNGEILWLNAHGIDYSTISPATASEEQKGVSHNMTLPRDYVKESEIKVVLLELCEEVCFRARALGKMGRTVSVYCRGADFRHPSGFFRQQRLPEPTAAAHQVYPWVLDLFFRHWDRKPLRALGIRLSSLTDCREVQLSLFDNREKTEALYRAMDLVRAKFGRTSLFRASSLTEGAQLFDRANKIGGHEA